MNKYILHILILSLCLVGCRQEKRLTSLLDVGFEKDAKTIEKNVSTDVRIHKLLNSSSNTHYGLDISHFQGDLMTVINPRDSIKFIICKATQGTTFLDPDFRSNWRRIRERGFIRGTYHFYDCSADPIKQADFFSNQIKDIEDIDIPPILDIEQGSMVKSVSAYQMEMDILKFLERVHKNTGRKPMIYTNYEFAKDNMRNKALADYDLWLAEYNDQPKPLVPNLWKEQGFKIWQKSASYHAYSRQIDLDVMFGSLKNIVK